MQVFHFPFSVYFLFVIIQFSNQKIHRLKKYWGGDYTPSPPSYAYAPDDDSVFVERYGGVRAGFNTNCPIIVH
jgi:hypothetical protein